MGKSLVHTLRAEGHVILPFLHPTYPDVLDLSNSYQLIGEYDATMTQTPILYNAQIHLPDNFRKLYPHGVFELRVIPDPAPENDEFFASHRRYRPQRIKGKDIPETLSLSREPCNDLDDAVIRGMDEDRAEYRQIINSLGWLRSTDRIKITMHKGGMVSKALRPTYVGDFLEAQHTNLSLIMRAADLLRPRRDILH